MFTKCTTAYFVFKIKTNPDGYECDFYRSLYRNIFLIDELNHSFVVLMLYILKMD